MATVSISDLLTQMVRIDPRDVAPADWVAVFKQLLENVRFEHFLGFKTLEQHLKEGFGKSPKSSLYLSLAPDLFETARELHPHLRMDAEYLPVAVIKKLPIREEWLPLAPKDGLAVFERHVLMSRAGELAHVSIEWTCHQVFADAALVIPNECEATEVRIELLSEEALLKLFEWEKRQYATEEPPFSWIGYQILMELMGAATTTRDMLQRQAEVAERYGDRVADVVSLFGNYGLTRLAHLPALPRLVIRPRRVTG